MVLGGVLCTTWCKMQGQRVCLHVLLRCWFCQVATGWLSCHCGICWTYAWLATGLLKNKASRGTCRTRRFEIGGGSQMELCILS